MPLSKKEQRKVSRALRRSEGGNNVSSRSSSFTPTQDIRSSIAGPIDASTEDDALQPRETEAREPITARSLSETFANLAVRQPPIARKTQVCTWNDGATVRLAARCHLCPGGQCPDPFLDCSEQKPFKEGSGNSKRQKTEVDSRDVPQKQQDWGTDCKLFATLTEIINQTPRQTPRDKSQTPEATQAQSTHRTLLLTEGFPSLPTSKPGTPQEDRRASPDPQSGSDGVNDQRTPSPSKSEVTPATPIELHRVPSGTYLPNSFDGTKDCRLDNWLVSDGHAGIDYAPRTEHWDGKSPSIFASFRAAARPIAKHTDLPPLEIPDYMNSRKPKVSHSFDVASEAQSEGTSLIEYSTSVDATSTGMSRSLPSIDAFGLPNPSSSGHVPGPPWGFRARAEHPWFNSPGRYVPDQNIFGSRGKYGSIPSVFDNLPKPLGCQSDLLTLPTSLPPRRGMPQSASMHPYEQSLYESRLESGRRMAHPDWTRDARGRGLEGGQKSGNPDRTEHGRPRVGIRQKTAQEDRYTRLINRYTQRFYGTKLDAARDLHHVVRPKKASDLGGLLP
ncbi:MAG: hypothetical protein L6R39_000449 [Caloplaca ligustica]|nr:MAG: hypothetical protein L6R39_000449 [Caloplaca ligustica]